MPTPDFNHLQNEKSPYLKQHAHQKIAWHAYGPEALLLAKEQNKPIFISIGYATCHWCHVMSHETFDDINIAQYMNEHFISIKVDRQEHPDLDQYMQKACMAMNGRGGWPLSAFCTTDLKPFFVGTYFPPKAMQNMPSFMEVLQEMHRVFSEENQVAQDNAHRIYELSLHAPRVSQKIEFEGHFPHANSILQVLEKYADHEGGGYGAAPKFPQFAFYEWAIEQMLEGQIGNKLGEHIILSVEKMLMGGIYDHVRGGIHRYATDANWLVPHFEKMLYDQAGLLRLLAKATLIYPSPLFYDAIIQTMDYLKKEMLSIDGHFMAAQDADSEGHEGLYFTFAEDEFKDAIISFDESLKEEIPNFLKWFNITEKGNFEKGLNVISLNLAHKNELFSQDAWTKIRNIRQALSEERKMRIPPPTDTNGMASWNFLLISALCDVIQYSKIESIIHEAQSMLNETLPNIEKNFITMLSDEKSFTITHATTNPGMDLLENYVHFAEMKFRLYEITADIKHLNEADQCMSFLAKEFYHEKRFYSRAYSLTENAAHPNLYPSPYDENYKSSLATLIGLWRKWCTVLPHYNEMLDTCYEDIHHLTHLALHNPLSHGEMLRSFTYPDEAYRKVEVPHAWAQDPNFKRFMPMFSVRFAILYHDRDHHTWQICTKKECELQGKGLEEFSNVFIPDEAQNNDA